MKRYLQLLTAFALAGSTAVGASAADAISVTTADGHTISVTAINDHIVKVSNLAAGEHEPASTACVLSPTAGSATITKSGALQQMSLSSGINATLASGGWLVIESGKGCSVTDYGLRINDSGRREVALYTDARGSYYGAGERGHSFNLAGDTLVMYNRQNYGYTGGDPRISQMNITMPLFLSDEGFAIVFDDYAAAKMVMTNPIRYITEGRRPVSYYYIGGVKTLADVTEQLSALTGRQELPPFWALGYITSKYGYHTQQETMGVIDTLRREGYPVDGIVLDLYWYGKEQDMGCLEWEISQWPTPVKMLKDLKRKGVNMVIISQPYVLRNGRGIDNYNALAPQGLFVRDSVGKPHDVKIWVGEGGMWDVSNDLTRQWLRQRYKELTDMGVGGWWGDLGEPEVHPETMLHANGLTAREYHNLYGNDWSHIIYDLFKEEYPSLRLMTMMRGGTTGLQRYSVYPWSTDVSRSWGGLKPQITIMLNSGLSGLGYMGHDVGGFAVDPAKPYMPELYVRWLQLGLFSPILRTHAQQFAEPYLYPEHAATIKRLIKERYRWLPYNYTLAWENASKGYPLVRPINFYDSSLSATFDTISDQYLWGRDVLVAPVLTEGATERTVTFPAGSRWIDIAAPAQRYDGGTTVTYSAPIDVLPIFARAGALIPLADYAMHNTGDYDPSRLTINYYYEPGVASQYTLYD
ncbi:MAG: TIM-barrel domain-containing protein, partial [Muribaculaceae bacterium]